MNPLLLEKAKQKGTDAQYLAWVRTMPSAITGTYSEWVHGKGRCEAAHVRRASDAGVAFKPPYSAIPLTHDEHMFQHEKGESIFYPPEWYDKQASRHLAMWINGVHPSEMEESDVWKKEYTVTAPGFLVALWLLFKKHFRNPNARNIKLTIQPAGDKRSNKQNKYYYGVVIPKAREFFIERGYFVSEKFVHDFLKSDIGRYVRYVSLPDGTVKTDILSSTKLTKKEWEEWMEKIRTWFAQYHWHIPLPNEVIYE